MTVEDSWRHQRTPVVEILDDCLGHQGTAGDIQQMVEILCDCWRCCVTGGDCWRHQEKARILETVGDTDCWRQEGTAWDTRQLLDRR